jgi:hypothetical protein
MCTAVTDVTIQCGSFELGGTPGSGGCTVARNLSDVNAVKDKHQRAVDAAQDGFRVSGLPPYGSLLHQGSMPLVMHGLEE